jgi:hypothetical protein
MDQTILNWLFAGFGAALGWLVKVVWDAIKDLKADMKQIERNLPEIYLRKDDFKAAMADIKGDMKELRYDMKGGFNKIDDALAMLFKQLGRKESKE